MFADHYVEWKGKRKCRHWKKIISYTPTDIHERWKDLQRTNLHINMLIEMRIRQ